MNHMVQEKEVKTKIVNVPKIKWYIHCDICNKDITGSYREQGRQNFLKHMEKHMKEDKK